jgi:shikimate kinase
VVIVGPPGAGKSTVGQLVAKRLGVEFVDTDELAAAVAGKTVADVFLEDGEDRFRALERAAVVDVLANGAGVVALGGGAVLNPDTRADLASQRVIGLTVELSEAVSRVGLARDRPLLVEAPRARMSATLRERAPLYAEVAALTVDTSHRCADDVAKEVVEWLASQE